VPQLAPQSPELAENPALLKAGSGDDVRQKNILELHDAILERQLALLKALNEHAVGELGIGQGVYGGIEVSVFLTLGRQFQPESGFLFLAEFQHFQRILTRPPPFWLSDHLPICTRFQMVVNPVDKA
jgi:hypothetical protein